MSQLAHRLALVLVISCLAFTLAAEEVWHEDEGWGLNLPEGWVLMDSRSEVGNLNFSDPAGHAILQVFGLAGSAREALPRLQAGMGAKPVAGSVAGTGLAFRFNGGESLLTEATWKAGAQPVRGYFMAIEASPGAAPTDASARSGTVPSAWILIAFAVEKEWPAYRLHLLSALDSFFVGEEAMYLPGPVSQADAGDDWAGGPVTNLELAVSAARAVADREAEILATYQKAAPEVQEKAWRRFYQMIWKDNFARLDDVADGLSRLFAKEKLARARMPARLLAWVQSFKDETYTNLADLAVPIDAVSRKAGDCDGRGLVYMILLEHLGFSSILLVSSVYQHSMVGVDLASAGIRSEGATFSLDQKQWTVAETMATVDLGQIAQDKADPENWIGFDLHFKP